MNATPADSLAGMPLSLYIHFPWCVRKCPYCDFNSHELREPIPAGRYVDTLLADLDLELECRLQQETGRELASVFMGGGTPSLIPAEEIDRLLTGIKQRMTLRESEITLEANPGTFDQAQFRGYREAGVNRISLGAQSFSQQALSALGRIHGPDDIALAFEGARLAGFKRINLDLMHGLPGQGLDDAMRDLDMAINLGPEHISWYQLTIEPNTVFHKRPPVLPGDDILADISVAGQRRLEDAGFRQYEVSAFARPHEQSRHNLNYWQFGDYLGTGAGAHGKLTLDGTLVRTAKTRLPTDYMRDPSARAHTVAQKDIILEFLMNALRLNDGFNLSLFEQRCLMAPGRLMPFMERASGRGLIQMTDNRVLPTKLGRRFLNELLLLVD